MIEENELDDDFRPESDDNEETVERTPKLTTHEARTLKKKIEDPIAKIAEWIAGRDEDLAAILRADGPKMASLLSRLAANAQTPMIVVLGIQLFASLLEPIDAFGRTAMHILKRMREKREERMEQVEHVTDEEEAEVRDFVPPPGDSLTDDHVAEPWKLG